MPLDDTSYRKVANDEDVAVIDSVTELLRRPSAWCKHAYTSPSGAHCLVGALNAATGGEYDLRRKWIGRLADLVAPSIEVVMTPRHARERLSIQRIVTWNDAPSRSHHDVLDLLNRARESLVHEHEATKDHHHAV